MKNTKSAIRSRRIFLGLVTACTLASGCNGHFALLEQKPTVQGTLCRRVSPSYDPIEPTTRFARDAGRIYCAWVVKGSSQPVAVRGVWYAWDVDKAAPPDYRIDEATVDIERDSKGSFSVSQPDRGWPAGRYRLEIYLDSRPSQVLHFVVE